MTDYFFTSDWFSSHIPAWERLLAPFKGRPDIGYLEVGVHEGRSLLWMLDNILTGPKASAVATGVFAPGAEDVLRENLRRCGSATQVKVLPGESRHMLWELRGAQFTIAYIDASHTAKDVLSDAVAVWNLMPVGGLLIFDDYEYGTPNDLAFRRHIPDQLRPRPAIDAFVTAHRDELRVLHRGWQLVVERRENPCQRHPIDERQEFDPDYCTPLGDLIYNWKTGNFYGPDAPALNARDRTLVEQCLNSPKFGHAVIPMELAGEPRLKELLTRLGVALEVEGSV